jgi:hypothetical protein
MFQIDESEAAFQKRLIGVAEELEWEWLHIGRSISRPNQGVRGSLLTGFPDLMLLRGSRLIFAELKAQKAPGPTVTQQLRLAQLSEAAECYIWRPSDWNHIIHVLAF